MTRWVFLDCETDGLHPKRQPWEIAWIVRDEGSPDVEHHAFLGIDTAHSDPAALRIGGYWERHPDPHHSPPELLFGFDSGNGVGDSWEVAGRLSRDLHGATLVGANPAFDAETLARFMRSYSRIPTWHYRLLDVQAMCAGALGWETPRSLDDCLSALGLVMPEEDRHTAPGDARAVRAIYDRLREVAWRQQVIAAEAALPEETIGVLREMRRGDS